MKRAVFALSIVSILAIAQPASAEVPVVWWWQPTYSVPITVVDTVESTIRPERLEAWRVIRDRALNNWGVPYRLVVRDAADYPPFDSTVLDESFAIEGAIRLGRNTTTGGCQLDYGGWMGDGPMHIQGGIAVFALCGSSHWWKHYESHSMSGVVGHEVGHALGLGHPDCSGFCKGGGIMAGGNQPSATELAAIQGYYGVA